MKRKRLSSVRPAWNAQAGPGNTPAPAAPDADSKTPAPQADTTLSIRLDLPAGLPFGPEPAPRLVYEDRTAA